jgi:hypothetical protein
MIDDECATFPTTFFVVIQVPHHLVLRTFFAILGSAEPFTYPSLPYPPGRPSCYSRAACVNRDLSKAPPSPPPCSLACNRPRSRHQASSLVYRQHIQGRGCARPDAPILRLETLPQASITASQTRVPRIAVEQGSTPWRRSA